MHTSSTSPVRSSQLGRGQACLRCRRRKMRCDGSRPVCDQCARANVLDCEYTDNGPTTSQLLEENVIELEARIRALQSDPAPVLLQNLHDAYAACRLGPAERITNPKPVDHSQMIMQSFLSVAPMLGFFFDATRFAHRLRRSTSREDQASVSSVLIRTIRLIGAHFSGEITLQRDIAQTLSSLLRDKASNLDDARKMDVLQAEVLLANYFLYTNRRTEGYYHIAGAVSIAVACNLYQIKTAAQDRRRLGSTHHIPSPTGDDDDDDDCIKAFWTVFALERTWSPWTTSAPAWPSAISNHEGTMTSNFSGISEQVASQVLSKMKTEIPEQLLLLLRSNSAILFGEAAYLADKRGTNFNLLHSEVTTLEGSVNNFARVASSFDLSSQDPHRQRSLLVTRTLLFCSISQLYEHVCKPGDVKYIAMLDASLAAVDSVRSLDVVGLKCVDPVLGMLWGIAGRTLIKALNLSRGTPPASPTSPTLSSTVTVSGNTVDDALNSLLSAMESLKPNCPLIGHELAALQAAV